MEKSLTLLPSGSVRLGRRYIGRISGNSYTKSCKELLHLHRASNSILISAGLLHSEIPFDNVMIRFIRNDGGVETLRQSRYFILTHGRCFKFEGYEEQIGLELSLWESENVNTNQQLTLFEVA